MVAAVITVGLAVVAWTTSTFSAQQQETSEYFSDRSQAIRENFVIEDVWFYATPSKGVNVTVRNVGTVDMNLTSIRFDGTGGTEWNQSRIIPKNTAATITIQPWNWVTETYKVVVASLRGQQITEYYSTTG
jgi:archaellum component FlaF (FlaF/FlaG flagellin family)